MRNEYNCPNCIHKEKRISEMPCLKCEDNSRFEITSKWISVGDILPKPNTSPMYPVIIKGIETWQRGRYCEAGGSGFWYIDNLEITENEVTHWFNLPELEAENGN